MDEPKEKDEPAPPPLSKNAQKRLQKQQRFEARKAERKAAEKDRRRRDLERRRREWEERLSGAANEEERSRMIESRKEVRKERMEKRAEERGLRAERLKRAAEVGQKVVVDLEFADLMTASEIHSLVQQIMYCYAVNGRCASPAHLWLTGCRGEMETQLKRIPGFDKWILEKEKTSYMEALQDQKENLVYLTADAETVLDELDPKKIYIIGGLVDRNRWKGITMKKANDQGIQAAKLPIANYLKMSSSQVLTVNQVVEILLKFSETRDWKKAFFQVIPLRKRDGEVEAEIEEARDDEAADGAEMAREDVNELELEDVEEEEEENDGDDCVRKRQRTKEAEDATKTVVGEEQGAGDAAEDGADNKLRTKKDMNGVTEGCL